MTEQGSSERRPTAGYVGWAVLGLLILGIVGVVAACISGFKQDYSGAGLCLIAAALSFGLLLNGLVRR